MSFSRCAAQAAFDFRVRIARQTFSAVTGISICVTP